MVRKLRFVHDMFRRALTYRGYNAQTINYCLSQFKLQRINAVDIVAENVLLNLYKFHIWVVFAKTHDFLDSKRGREFCGGAENASCT